MRTSVIELAVRLSALSSNELFRQIDVGATGTHLDLSDVIDINPAGLLNILLTVRWLKQLDQRVTMALPKDPRLVWKLHSLHLLGQLNALNVGYAGRTSNLKRFGEIELPHFSTDRIDTEEKSRRIGGGLYRHLLGMAGYPNAEAEAVANVVTELCGNLWEHCDSPEGGYSVIQVVSVGDRLSTIVALGDVGIGLRRSLTPYFKHHGISPTSDADVIREATRPGVSSKYRIRTSKRGEGLANVVRLTQKYGYHLGIRTGDTLLHFAPLQAQVPHVGAPFPGTQVFIALEHHVLTSGGR